MKKFGFFMFFLLFFGLTTNLYSEKQLTEQEKAVLQDNINNLRNQSITVQVLGNQYNKELAELRRMEAVFCDLYELDVAKWRQGIYTWNEEQEKFIVSKPEGD